jgi:hypothetical protein
MDGDKMIIQLKTGDGPDRHGTDCGGTDGDIEAMLFATAGRRDGWVVLDNLGTNHKRGDFDSYEWKSLIDISDLRGVVLRIRGRAEIDDWHLEYMNVTDRRAIWRWEPDQCLSVAEDGTWRYYCFGECSDLPTEDPFTGMRSSRSYLSGLDPTAEGDAAPRQAQVRELPVDLPLPRGIRWSPIDMITGHWTENLPSGPLRDPDKKFYQRGSTQVRIISALIELDSDDTDDDLIRRARGVMQFDRDKLRANTERGNGEWFYMDVESPWWVAVTIVYDLAGEQWIGLFRRVHPQSGNINYGVHSQLTFGPGLTRFNGSGSGAGGVIDWQRAHTTFRFQQNAVHCGVGTVWNRSASHRFEIQIIVST